MRDQNSYLIIGKSKQMRSVMVCTGFQKFEQRPIRLGVQFVLTEQEMNFHVWRQAAKGVLKVVELGKPEVSELQKMIDSPTRASNLKKVLIPPKAAQPAVVDPPKRKSRRKKS